MAYLRANIHMLVAGTYALLAGVLYFAGVADIFPPCLISRLIGRPCPGCGLTRAGLALLRSDVRAAWTLNPMIFIVAPAAVWFFAADVCRFYRMRRLVRYD